MDRVSTSAAAFWLRIYWPSHTTYDAIYTGTSLVCAPGGTVVLTKAGQWGCSGTAAVSPYTLPSGCTYLNGADRIFVGQDGTLERTTKW